MADKEDQLLIAAIDFGTTHSGYAFSFENDYKVDPLKISTNQNWVAGSRGLVSLKAPTCVLLNPRQEFRNIELYVWYGFKDSSEHDSDARCIHEATLFCNDQSFIVLSGKFLF